MNIKVVVFALVMTASMGVQGVSFDTGLSLLKSCEADPDTSGTFFEQGFCAGYIVSVHDTVATLAHWEGFAEYICPPEGVTSGQFRKVVVRVLNENPEKLHLNAGSLVLNALEGAFPCE